MADDRKLAAVYAPWQTFLNSLNQLKNGVPTQIDRTVFPGMAGAVQNQLFAGYKFLGLTDDAGKPTDSLRKLATAEDDERKGLMARLLRDRYDKLFALDLTQSTLALVLQTLSDSYGVAGDTRDKALRFFLSAAEFSGIGLSSYIQNAKRSTSPRKAKGNGSRSRVSSEEFDQEDEEGPPPPASGTSKTIQLKSGGTVTVSASLDVFSLKPDDRAFVFELIDKLNAYEGS